MQAIASSPEAPAVRLAKPGRFLVVLGPINMHKIYVECKQPIYL